MEPNAWSQEKPQARRWRYNSWENYPLFKEVFAGTRATGKNVVRPGQISDTRPPLEAGAVRNLVDQGDKSDDPNTVRVLLLA